MSSRLSIPGVFALCAITLVSAKVGRAQDYCSYTFCDAAAYYDLYSNVLYGYARVTDYGSEEVGIQAYIVHNYDPPAYYGASSGYYQVTVNVYYPNPPGLGYYFIRGDAYYQFNYFWTYDGYGLSNPVGVIIYPQSETSAFYSYDGPYFVLFRATLQPSTWDYDGGTLQEYHDGSTDACWLQYPNGPTFPQVIPGAPFTMYGNQYQDRIGTNDVWADVYSPLIRASTISRCGWSVGQWYTFEGRQFVNRTVGQNLDGYNVETYRDVSVSEPWQ